MMSCHTKCCGIAHAAVDALLRLILTDCRFVNVRGALRVEFRAAVVSMQNALSLFK